MGLLIGRVLEKTTVSYLATCLGCERKTASASLGRLAEHGLDVRSGPHGIALDYDEFSPSPTIFRAARKAAKRRGADPAAYPEFLTRAVGQGKIPESYLDQLRAWVEQSSDHLNPHDWAHLVIDKCWQEHQSLKAKKGIPYPALQFLGETANRIWGKRASIPTG